MTFTGYYAGILTELDRTADRIEVTVDVTGQVAVNGWADPDQLDALRRELDVRPASDGRATRMRRR